MTVIKQTRNAAMMAALAVGHSVAMAQPVDIFVTYGPAGVASVPTLSEWGMIIMAIMLAGAAVYAMRKNANSKSIMSIGLAALAMAGAAGGNNILNEAWSISASEMTAPTGGSISVPVTGGVVPVTNATQVPLKIISVTPNSVQNAAQTTCMPGVIVTPGGTCNVDTGSLI